MKAISQRKNTIELDLELNAYATDWGVWETAARIVKARLIAHPSWIGSCGRRRGPRGTPV
ncbi:Uncharacterised protein [uncultured Actinomyces sp.]|nr:Uncharacterised protein [uncultured Actinomyces sp.]